MAEELYDRDFPELKKLGYKRDSEPAYYNCVALAVGDMRRKWWRLAAAEPACGKRKVW
jgi:hypothetical protein